MSAATGAIGMSGHRQCSGTVKRKRWGGLRQQWKLLGLFEIDEEHEFYSLTCMMKEGLAAAIQNTTDNPPTVSRDQQRQHLSHQNMCICSTVFKRHEHAVDSHESIKVHKFTSKT